MHDELNQSTLTLDLLWPFYTSVFTLNNRRPTPINTQHYAALRRTTRRASADIATIAHQIRTYQGSQNRLEETFFFKSRVNGIFVEKAELHSRDETVLVHRLFAFALWCLRPHLHIPDCQHLSSTNSRHALPHAMPRIHSLPLRSPKPCCNAYRTPSLSPEVSCYSAMR